MNAKLVIGCKTCFEGVMETRGYTINSNGLLRTPFVTSTAYSIDDLYELFIQNYTCPYCQNTLTLTPAMMGFINDYIGGKYHIDFNEGYINIINDRKTFKVDKNADVKTITESLQTKDKDFNLFTDEIKEILNVANDIDSSKWIVRIESGHIKEPFINKVEPEMDKWE